MMQNIHQRTGSAGFSIARAEHHMADTAVYHRTSAHDARLKGHIQRRVNQTIILQDEAALT